jgi:hypothetical protein
MVILKTKIGGSDVQVNELPDAIKTVLVQWSHVKIDLNELARLRWIKKMTTPEIATELGWGRTAVQTVCELFVRMGFHLAARGLTALEILNAWHVQADGPCARALTSGTPTGKEP